MKYILSLFILFHDKLYCIPTAAHSLICRCSEGIGCGEDHMHHNLTCNTTGKCYKKIEWDHDSEVISYGCIPTEIQSHFSCKTDFSKHVKRRHGVLCCNSRDLCNSELEPTIPPTTAPEPSGIVVIISGFC